MLPVMDLFRVVTNERPSELCLHDKNSEEVNNLQSPDENKIFVLLSSLVDRFRSPVCRVFASYIVMQGWAICSVTTSWQHRDRIRDRICDRTVIVKWQANFFWTRTVIMLLNGPICWAIWGDITWYRAISPDIGRY